MKQTRWLLLVMFGTLLLLQYRLWIGQGSLPDLWRMQNVIADQREANDQLLERNRLLEAEVIDLKHGLEAVEERARNELGMIGPNETFYQLVDQAPSP